MKKLTAFILAALMILTLCACGAAKPEKIQIEYEGEVERSIKLDLNGDYDEDELTLTAVLEPAGSKGDIAWESSGESVVSVEDNGDGSCSLALNGGGEAKITASCGELTAKIKVTVEAPEEEAAEEAAAVPETVLPAFTAVCTGNPSGVPFTPNDIIACGILSTGAEEYETMLEHISILSSKEPAEGSFTFGCGSAVYTIDDSRITSITTEVNGRRAEYSFGYDGDYLTRIAAEFGVNKSARISFSVSGNQVDAVESTGYGGNSSVTGPGERLEIDAADGGCSFRFDDGGKAYLEFGTAAGGNALIRLNLKADVHGNGLGISSYEACEFDRGITYRFYSWSEEGYLCSNTDAIFRCTVNGSEVSLIRRLSGNMLVLEYEAPGGDISLRYGYSFEGEYIEGYWREPGNDRYNYIDADGISQ